MPGFSDADRGELLRLQASDKPVNLTHARPHNALHSPSIVEYSISKCVVTGGMLLRE